MRLVWMALGSTVGVAGFEMTKRQWNQARDLFYRLNAAVHNGDDRVWFVRVGDMWSMGLGCGLRDMASRFPTEIARIVADAHRRAGHEDVELVETSGAPGRLTNPLPPWWQYVEIEGASPEAIARALAVEAEVDGRPANDGEVR
jgi:hypothetical protein